jgi:ubiquinone/menaquinone biosynthesis C-methylase UbiE
MSVGFNLFAALETGFAPTPEEVARSMMQVARLQRGEIFYDLGSGDGALLIMAAKEFGARAVGVEIQKKMVAYSVRRIRSLGLESVIKVVRGDFFEADIIDADVLALYMIPEALRRLRSKLERELKRGARVVVYKYPVEGWKPKEIHDAVSEREEAKIFLYEL